MLAKTSRTLLPTVDKSVLGALGIYGNRHAAIQQPLPAKCSRSLSTIYNRPTFNNVQRRTSPDVPRRLSLNSAAFTPRPAHPPAGVWAPSVTFFDPATDTLDLDAQAAYFRYLSQHLTGLLILGTNAETFLLTRSERAALLRTAVAAVPPSYPLMAGVSGHSTAQVKEYIDDAVAAGVSNVLVLPCGYFPGASSNNAAVLEGFFADVAAHSPVPVLVYNFPAVCNGIDLDSDFLTALAERAPNVVGCKLTCGSVAKVTRLAARFDGQEGRGGQERYAVFGGQADFLVGGLAAGSAGCIAAFANVAPKVVKKVYDLYTEGQVAEALRLQRVAALAEGGVGKNGMAFTKYAASLLTAQAAGIENAEGKLRPRKPYLPPGQEAKAVVKKRLEELLKIEAQL